MLLQAKGLRKRFGSNEALKGVTLGIGGGEVVGLVGRRGAGKTLLTQVLAGLQTADEGELWLGGKLLRWPFIGKREGINLIHPGPMLAEQFDIVTNIFLGHEMKVMVGGWSTGLLDWRRMERRGREILVELDVDFPSLGERVGNLSGEERQLIALAQAMATEARVQIVDDPTELLTSPYQTKLLSLIGRWKAEGRGVLFSSENLDHLFAVTDRIVVLAEGEVLLNLPSDQTNREEIVAALVGNREQQQRTPVIWALDSYYEAKRQAENLEQNQQLLERDLVVRETMNEQLLAQLAKQVEALNQANVALQDAQRRLLTERELERKHLARELHDETIQDLLSLNYQLEEVESLAEGNGTLVAEVDDIRHHIRELVSNVRGICSDLRPPTIDSLGLGAALQSYVHSWQERTGIDVVLELSDDLGRLPEAIELSMFRIVQEGLSNVWKHSEGTRVTVALTHISPRLLQIMIEDNGIGLGDDFDLVGLSRSGHYGLLGISERVALLGGKLRFQNQDGGGLMVIAEIPHPRAMRDEW